MKLAVKKEPGATPGTGFHYMTHIMPMQNDFEVASFGLMGYVIIEVSDEDGTRMLKDANAAILHQLEIAPLADKAEAEASK